MKLDTYEVPFGTDGRTLRVNTVKIFDNDTTILDNGNYNSKKIKTDQGKVKDTMKDYSIAVARNNASAEPVIESPVAVEEPKIVMPEVGHRYSFETAMEEPVVEERPVVSTAYQRKNLTATASINEFNQHIHKMTRLAQLEEELKNLVVGTWRYKTTAKAIEILEECKNKKDEQETIINNYLRERETKTKEYELAIKNLEDHYRNYMEEINVKLSDAEKTKAAIQKIEDARIIEINTSIKNATDADKKVAEVEKLVNSGITIDINSAETKKPISVQNTGVLNKFKTMEDEITKGGRGVA